jgi:protein involved in polysaccharide export with SLBB domain
MKPISVLLAALALCQAGCRSSPELPENRAPCSLSSELSWRELTLGPNDIVRVGVWNHPELSTPLSGTGSGAVGTRVDGEGRLSLPLVGALEVAGLSLEQARGRIRDAYAVYVQEPKVDVSIVQYGARQFFLYGEVNQPGAYSMERPLTLYQALSLGRGFTTRALRDQIVLLRGKPETLEVHVFDGEDPELTGLFAVRPDDFLFVRRSRAGKFSDEALPILQGISSSLGSVATVLLIDDQLKNN